MTVGSHASAFSDGEAYEATLGQSHRYYMRVKASLLRRLLRRHAPRARRLVDLGCGTGEMAAELSDGQFEITGVDLSPQMIAHARSKKLPHANFVSADAGDTKLPAHSFDVAFATALFHHVPTAERAGVAREFTRLLRSGGLAIVFEHNPANPITRRIVRTCPVDEGVELLPRKALADALSAAGLTVVEHRYLLFFPRPLAVFQGLERVLGWCPAGGQYVVIARRDPGAT